MFNLFKKSPLEVLPEYNIDGDNVVFQEVVVLDNGIALKDAFKRAAEFFLNFENSYKYNIKPNVKDVKVDFSSNTIAFSYAERIAGEDGSKGSWCGVLHSGITIQFKEGRFRYTMSIAQLSRWDYENKRQYYKASYIITHNRWIFNSIYTSESYDIGLALRYAAKRIRSIIYHSTKRPDEDW